MATEINDDSLRLEVGGIVIARATKRVDGWWEGTSRGTAVTNQHIGITSALAVGQLRGDSGGGSRNQRRQVRLEL